MPTPFAASEVARYLLLLLPVLMYSKLKREKVLDHFVRGQIFGHIKTNPGTHYSRIKRLLQVTNGTLTYHLYTLEREGFVKSRSDGNLKRYYPAGFSEELMKGIMLSKVQQQVVDGIRREPGITQTELANRLGISRQNLNYHMKKLGRVGEVRLVEDGRETRCYPPDEEDDLLIKTRESQMLNSARRL